MSDRRSPKRGEPERTISRRGVLGATAATVVGTGALLASAAPVQARTTDFGDVSVGDSRTREITTENPVDRPLEVTDLTITGSDAEAFSVVGGDAPFDVGPNESHTTRIRFAPTSAGEKSAKVTVDTSIRSSMTAGRLAGRGVEEGAASASSEDEAEASTDGPDGSESDSESSSDDTDASSNDESSSEDSSPDGSSSGSTESDESSDDSGSSDSSDTESSSGQSSDPSSTADVDTGDASSTPEEVPGERLTEILDVNDDGVVNLRDFQRILRRRDRG